MSKHRTSTKPASTPAPVAPVQPAHPPTPFTVACSGCTGVGSCACPVPTPAAQPEPVAPLPAAYTVGITPAQPTAVPVLLPAPGHGGWYGYTASLPGLATQLPAGFAPTLPGTQHSPTPRAQANKANSTPKPAAGTQGNTATAGEPARYTLLGYPVTQVLRYMGSTGSTPKQATAVLARHGVACSPATVKTQLQHGRKGTKLPALPPAVVAQLVA